MNEQLLIRTLLIGAAIGIGYLVLGEVRERRNQKAFQEIHQTMSYVCKDLVDLQDKIQEGEAE